jgi:hypothetical protein
MTEPRRVILESPYAGDTPEDVSRNTAYAAQCMLDSLRLGEAPMVSHLLYTQVLDDRIPEDRRLGIEAGLAWGDVAEATVVYVDFGITKGMREGIERALAAGRPVEKRSIV